jgi:hypothetical protein
MYDGLMATNTVTRIASFSNVDEVFDKLLELGFFVNEEHKAESLREISDPNPSPHDSNEFWYSNGHVELKIFRGMFGAYELCNFRGIKHKEVEALFGVASMPKL